MLLPTFSAFSDLSTYKSITVLCGYHTLELLYQGICKKQAVGCGINSQKEVATVFSENVTQVDITHRIGTEITNWSIEGTEIDPLRIGLTNSTTNTLRLKMDSLLVIAMEMRSIPLLL